MEDRLCALSDDLITEILLDLPSKYLVAFKCTSKRWYRFVSDPTFSYIYTLWSINSRPPLGVFVQRTYHCCDTMRDMSYYCSLGEEAAASDNILDFLPERTALVSSSNGILCCRNLITGFRCRDVFHRSIHARIHINAYPVRPQVIYICNPTTKEWISLKPPIRFNYGKAFALDFDPRSPNFTLVGIQHSQDNPDWCSFVTYNSQLKTWKASREFKCFASQVRPDQHVFLNGKCRWLTWTNHMVTFDVVRESCQVIDLPQVSSLQEKKNWIRRGCLGVSQDNIHYACAYDQVVKIWVVKDYGELPQWIPVLTCPPILKLLKIKFAEMIAPWSRHGCSCFDPPRPEYKYSSCLKALHIYNDVYFFALHNKIVFYDTKSGDGHLLGVFNIPQEDLVLLKYWPTVLSLKGLDDSLSQRSNFFPSVKRRRRSKSILPPKRARR